MRFIYALAILFAALAINREESSVISAGTSMVESCLRPRITMSDPCGKFANWAASAWRIWRDTRWRRTDPPTLFPIIKPARGFSFAAGVMCRYPTKCSDVTRRPLLVVRAKSCGEVKRADTGSTSIKSGSALPSYGCLSKGRLR